MKKLEELKNHLSNLVKEMEEKIAEIEEKIDAEIERIGKEKKYLPMSSLPKLEFHTSLWSITIYYENGVKDLKSITLNSGDDMDIGADYMASFCIESDGHLYYSSSRGTLYWDNKKDIYVFDTDDYENEVVGYIEFEYDSH